MRRVLAVWLLVVALLHAVVPLGARTSAAMTPPTTLSFDADQYGSFVGSTAVPFGTWPSSFPSVTRSGTPASMLYALEGGASSPPPTGTVTAHLVYRYDAAGRRTGLTLPDGKSESWSYDAAGRVNSLVQPGTSPATYTLSHDGAGDPTTLLAPNGGQESWSYDNAGRVTGTSWFTGTTGLFTQTVTLDAAGQHTVSTDSWGTTSYGYDAAGRLVSASYPDGSSEADQYDAGGNRTVITDTVGLTSTVISNSYDLADQLNTSSATVNGGTAALTTYAYDGNGQQLGSAGPNGTVTTTYNDLGQLTQVQGPTTNVSYVYDGQGDRLRSYEQDGPTPVLTNDVQDLAAGLSDLVSDGTADYTYLTPGMGAAPVSAYNQSTTRSSYLATDVLGSVRLATDPTGAVIGAGAYDAWGVSRPYQGTSGPTQLAGLQASSPFGYTGQYYDSGPGTYSMRAREYSPIQGRFLSQDPRPYDPQVPVTLNPYEYAGDMVTQTTDPSGKGWLITGSIGGIDYGGQSLIAGLAMGDRPLGGALGIGEIAREQSPWNPSQPAAAPTTEFWVQVLQRNLPPCRRQPTRAQLLSLYNNHDAYSANIVDNSTHMVWDIERASAYTGALGGEIQKRLVNNANSHGYWWESADCNRRTGASDCAATLLSAKDGPLTKGSAYPGIFGLHTENINIALLGVAGPPLRVNYRPGRIMPVDVNAYEVAWEQEPGLILYKVLSGKTLSDLILREHQADPGIGFGALGIVAQGSELVLEDYGTQILRRGEGDFTSNILVVGESDTFEYSKALARKYPSYRIVATRYGSGAPPSDVPANMFVVDNVDATNLSGTLANTPEGDLQFDATVFNNPFTTDSSKAAGGDRYVGVARLVVDYWRSAGGKISPNGRIVVNINPQLYDPTRNPKNYSVSLRQVLSKAEDKGSFGADPLYAEFTGMSSTGAPLRDVDPTTGLPRQGSGLQTFELPVGQVPTIPEE